MSKIEAALKATQQLLAQGNPDPAMADIAKQLQAASRGEQHQYTMDRIIMYNYEPAPTPQLQEWAQLVLDASLEIGGEDDDFEDEE
jgi:hypothetical protein